MKPPSLPKIGSLITFKPQIGSLLSIMFPQWLIVVLLVILLGYSAYQTLLKGVAKWIKQSKEMIVHYA